MPDRTTNSPDPGKAEDAPRARGGETVTQQGETQAGVPRMPHERDESADSQEKQEQSNERVARAGQKDVERGVADTTKGAELDATYDRLREDVPDGQKKFRR